jgi:uncharacterized membrane protein YccC
MKNKRKSAMNTLVGIVVMVLVAAAIWDQLRRPSAERTWHGTILNVPYDFRIPTKERLQATFWNKDDARLFVPHAFGVGWSINFYPLVHTPTVQSVQ